MRTWETGMARLGLYNDGMWIQRNIGRRSLGRYPVLYGFMISLLSALGLKCSKSSKRPTPLLLMIAASGSFRSEAETERTCTLPPSLRVSRETFKFFSSKHLLSAATMPDHKDATLGQPRAPSSWLRRTDTFLALQAILALVLLRLVLYSYTSLPAEEREVSLTFVLKFAALVLVLLCLAFQSLT